MVDLCIQAKINGLQYVMKMSKTAEIGFKLVLEKIKLELLALASKDLTHADPYHVLEKFANQLTKKLIHQPTMHIRDCALEQRKNELDNIREWLDESETT